MINTKANAHDYPSSDVPTRPSPYSRPVHAYAHLNSAVRSATETAGFALQHRHWKSPPYFLPLALESATHSSIGHLAVAAVLPANRLGRQLWQVPTAVRDSVVHGGARMVLAQKEAGRAPRGVLVGMHASVPVVQGWEARADVRAVPGDSPLVKGLKESQLLLL